MFINPQTAVDEGWIHFPEWMEPEFRKKCMQPNAIDITADRMFCMAVNSHGFVHISETTKQLPAQIELFASQPLHGTLPEDMWNIQNGRIYDAMSDFYVEIPDGVAAELTIRSTLNRCGLALNSGIWDSGFKGNLGMIIHNRSLQDVWLAPHTRVCQIKFIASDSNGSYAGGYNTERGQHWTTKSTGPR